MPPVSPPMIINVKQFIVREIFFLYFSGGARKKSLGTTDLEDYKTLQPTRPQSTYSGLINCIISEDYATSRQRFALVVFGETHHV
jgi:hypothetical protein